MVESRERKSAFLREAVRDARAGRGVETVVNVDLYS